MRKSHFFTLFLIWSFLCSVSFGYSGGNGTASAPYQILDSHDLLELARTTGDYGRYFILTADIDMQGEVFTAAIIAKDTDGGSPGFQGTAFFGNFDGNGHKITNFTINGGSNDYLGLFGYIESGAVKNLGLEGCAILYSTYSEYIGGLAGYTVSGSLSHCYTTGDVGGVSDSMYIGGLVGLNLKGTLTYCYSTGNVGGSQDAGFTGGLAGSNGADGTIIQCYSTGTVNGNFEAGGLCGENNGLIRNCYAAGAVSGPDNAYYLGGLCGFNDGTIEDCYATGSVRAGNGSYIVGGLCGENSSSKPESIINCYATGSVTAGESSCGVGGLCGENFDSTIINCYSTGAVDGGISPCNLGGLCGFQTGEFALTSNSFWDAETSNTTVGYNLNIDAHGTITDVFGVTTSQMWIQSTFSDYGWDFVNETVNGTQDIWRMCEDGIDYPRLKWQSVAGDFVCPLGVGTADLEILSGCWLAIIRASADINQDNAVNLADLSIVSRYWMKSNCGLCNGADVTGDGNVDSFDVIQIAEQWLFLETAGCQTADLNTDDKVDLADMAIFAQHWLEGATIGGVE
jgi:hypothetical protein